MEQEDDGVTPGWLNFHGAQLFAPPNLPPNVLWFDGNDPNLLPSVRPRVFPPRGVVEQEFMIALTRFLNVPSDIAAGYTVITYGRNRVGNRFINFEDAYGEKGFCYLNSSGTMFVRAPELGDRWYSPGRIPTADAVAGA